MLDQEKVLQMFAAYTGLDSDALTRWQCLCDSASHYIAGRLRTDVDATAEMDALCSAAAVMAFADYLALQHSAGSADELRVGDIALSSSSSNAGGMGAEQMLNYFLARVAHLLEPDCPALLAVEEIVPDEQSGTEAEGSASEDASSENDGEATA